MSAIINMIPIEILTPALTILGLIFGAWLANRRDDRARARLKADAVDVVRDRAGTPVGIGYDGKVYAVDKVTGKLKHYGAPDGDPTTSPPAPPEPPRLFVRGNGTWNPAEPITAAKLNATMDGFRALNAAFGGDSRPGVFQDFYTRPPAPPENLLMRRFLDAVPLKVGKPHPGKMGWVVQKVEITPHGNVYPPTVASWEATSALILPHGQPSYEYTTVGVVTLDCRHDGNPEYARFCKDCGEQLSKPPRDEAGEFFGMVASGGDPFCPNYDLARLYGFTP